MKQIEKKIFNNGGDEELVPEYLRNCHPLKDGEPCREYLMTLKKWGERPPGEALLQMANQIYAEHRKKEDRKLA